MPNRAQRVAVVDHDPAHLDTLLVLLRPEDDLEVVGYAADGYDLIFLALSEQPDVVVCDLDLPGLDAVAARPLIRTISPQTRMLVVTDASERSEEMRAAGVEAWVPRSRSGREVLEALRGA